MIWCIGSDASHFSFPRLPYTFFQKCNKLALLLLLVAVLVFQLFVELKMTNIGSSLQQLIVLGYSPRYLRRQLMSHWWLQEVYVSCGSNGAASSCHAHDCGQRDHEGHHM